MTATDESRRKNLSVEPTESSSRSPIAAVRRKKRRASQEPTLRAKLVGFAVLLSACLYLLSLWQIETFLDTLESDGGFQIPEILRKGKSFVLADGPRHSTSPSNGKFLVFTGLLAGQGEGNVMAGLLAAHLLGYEFNRTVCVADSYESFHETLMRFIPTRWLIVLEFCNFGATIQKSLIEYP